MVLDTVDSSVEHGEYACPRWLEEIQAEMYRPVRLATHLELVRGVTEPRFIVSTDTTRGVVVFKQSIYP